MDLILKSVKISMVFKMAANNLDSGRANMINYKMLSLDVM